MHLKSDFKGKKKKDFRQKLWAMSPFRNFSPKEK
jgi:hypothetical protein